MLQETFEEIKGIVENKSNQTELGMLVVRLDYTVKALPLQVAPWNSTLVQIY